MKRKGLGMDRLMILLVAVATLAVLLYVFMGAAEAAEESAKGCSIFASIISDITGGALTLC